MTIPAAIACAISRCAVWREIPIRAAVTANNLDTVLECAVGGLGIALLPFTVVSPSLAAGELALVLSDLLGQEAQLYALYPPHRRGSLKIRAFLSTMEAFIEAEATPMLSALGAVVVDPDDGS